MHIIGCNFVVTLVGFGTKRNNKCKLKWSAHATTLGASNTTYLHKANSQRKADAQVMTMRPFCRKNRIRNKEENAERQDCHTQPTRSLRLCGDVYRESIALEKKKSWNALRTETSTYPPHTSSLPMDKEYNRK